MIYYIITVGQNSSLKLLILEENSMLDNSITDRKRDKKKRLDKIRRRLKVSWWFGSSSSFFHSLVLFKPSEWSAQYEFSLPVWLICGCALVSPPPQRCWISHHLQDPTELQEPDGWKRGGHGRWLRSLTSEKSDFTWSNTDNLLSLKNQDQPSDFAVNQE